MGQYYYVVNVDKKQYLHPHDFGDGLKLMEFGLSGMGTLSGLAILLADGNGRGGGDLHSENPIIGSWAGDRIVIAGDYADPWVDPQESSAGEADEEGQTLYNIAYESYENISAQVISALKDDDYARTHMRRSFA